MAHCRAVLASILSPKAIKENAMNIIRQTKDNDFKRGRFSSLYMVNNFLNSAKVNIRKTPSEIKPPSNVTLR